MARNGQTGVAEGARHAETTRDYGTSCLRDYGTSCPTDYHRDAGKHQSQARAAASPMTALCSLHGKTMVLREKDGDRWYSHRLPDGSWCRGAAGDAAAAEAKRRAAAAQSARYRRRYALQFAGMGIPLPTDGAHEERATSGRPPPAERDETGSGAPTPEAVRERILETAKQLAA